jgi:predicted short-subunit dehydrogenase-like oxidoreductase (DUF2520 family)
MNMRIAFIGAGRLATALSQALARQGLDVVAIASRSSASAQALAARLPGCRVLAAQAAVEAADLVFITVPDDAIATTAAAMRWRAGQSVVHCSGATEVSSLAAAAAAGAQTGGLHPMQTFADPQAALDSLPGCTASIEAGEPLYGVLAGLAERIGCVPLRLPAGARALYHGAGGFGSQFVNALLAEGVAVWQSFGADPAQAERSLLSLLKGTVASIERSGIAGSMAGPVSRGDIGTIRRHLEAFRQGDAGTLAIYRLLCERTVRLAAQAGKLSPAQVREFETLLSDTAG